MGVMVWYYILAADLGDSVANMAEKGKSQIERAGDPLFLVVLVASLVYAFFNKKVGVNIAIGTVVLYLIYSIVLSGGVGLFKSLL